MSPFHLIYVQYVLAVGGWSLLLFATLFRRLDGWKPARALLWLVAPHASRFLGAFALGAVGGNTGVPLAFGIQVVVGDCLTAALAIVALVLLAKGSPRAGLAVVVMSCVGLVDILADEAWIGGLQLSGQFILKAAVHAPSVGPPALMTALHVFAFYFVAKAAREGGFRQTLALKRVQP